MPGLDFVQPDGNELGVGQVDTEAKMPRSGQAVEAVLPLNALGCRARHRQGPATQTGERILLGHTMLLIMAGLVASAFS
jgi:hypothetical protein